MTQFPGYCLDLKSEPKPYTYPNVKACQHVFSCLMIYIKGTYCLIPQGRQIPTMTDLDLLNMTKTWTTHTYMLTLS